MNLFYGKKICFHVLFLSICLGEQFHFPCYYFTIYSPYFAFQSFKIVCYSHYFLYTLNLNLGLVNVTLRLQCLVKETLGGGGLMCKDG